MSFTGLRNKRQAMAGLKAMEIDYALPVRLRDDARTLELLELARVVMRARQAHAPAEEADRKFIEQSGADPSLAFTEALTTFLVSSVTQVEVRIIDQNVRNALAESRLGGNAARERLISIFEQRLSELIARAQKAGAAEKPTPESLSIRRITTVTTEDDTLLGALEGAVGIEVTTVQGVAVKETFADELVDDESGDEEPEDGLGDLSLEAEFDAFEREIAAVSERIWRDFFLLNAPSSIRRRLLPWSPSQRDDGAEDSFVQRTRCAHVLMLLRLQASLYGYRTSGNVAGDQLEAGKSSTVNPTRGKIREKARDYICAIGAWDHELAHASSGTHYFHTGFLDSQRFRTLAKDMGAYQETEIGWKAQANDARTEMRYQWFESLLRERVRAHNYLAAAGYWLLKVTTGYGTEPAAFIRFAVLTVIGFALAFLVNDALNPGIGTDQYFCSNAQFDVSGWQGAVNEVVHYLYLAVTNLSSLGSNSQLAGYCGGLSTQALLIVASLTGYFLLAMLAALFYQLLTSRD